MVYGQDGSSGRKLVAFSSGDFGVSDLDPVSLAPFTRAEWVKGGLGDTDSGFLPLGTQSDPSAGDP